ncbi:hypothetical protein HYW75_03610 [Candidatus Pacearchaeota archaeon]|nr:hypothetical protein [Candidatus Pacearchaeota archaeon]
MRIRETSHLLRQIPPINLEEEGRITIYRGLHDTTEIDHNRSKKIQGCWTLSYFIARVYAIYYDPSTLVGMTYEAPTSGCIISASAPISIPDLKRAIEMRNGRALELEEVLRNVNSLPKSSTEIFGLNKVIWLRPEQFLELTNIHVVDYYPK